MKNISKGFTLIELIAVIVILAIISLIATPIIFNIIESSRRSAAERSVDNIKKTAELYYMNNIDVNGFEGVMFICDGNSCKSGDKTIEINGAIPNSGTISISSDGTIVLNNIVVDGYNASNPDDSDVDKTISLATNSSTIEIKNAKGGNLLNYQIYGNPDDVGVYNLLSITTDVKILESVYAENACKDFNCITNSTYNNFEIETNEQNIPTGSINAFGRTYVYFVAKVDDPGAFYTASFIPSTTSVHPKVRISNILNKSEIKYLGNSSKLINLETDPYNYPATCQIGNTRCYRTFKTERDTNYILFGFFSTKSTTVKEFQIVKGENNTQEYTSYNNGKTTIPITVTDKQYKIEINKPLSCNTSGVCDYIDYKTQKIYRYDGKVENVELPEIEIPEGDSNLTIGTTITPTKINLVYE